MVPIGSSFFTVSDPPPNSGSGPIIVWLGGEHDISTDDALCATLASAIALDSAGLILDLSGVEFMAASTLGVIVWARTFLRQRARSLTVQAPSARAWRVINACNLNDLLGPSPEIEGDVAGEALDSWVAVAAVERSDGQPGPSVRVPERVPVLVGPTIDLTAQAVSTQRPAESE
jgi:anti-anti-sigma factor